MEKLWNSRIEKYYYKFLRHYGTDRAYIKYVFQKKLGRPLDLKNPKTYSEKLQWLKLHDRNPLYKTLVDKVQVKEWVANCIGEQYIIPTLGVYHSFDEIDFDQLPEQFVLKCNHDSGSVCICKDKKSFDLPNARRVIANALNRDFFVTGREWPYKNMKRLVFAEKWIGNDLHGDLVDYKFFCFHGIAHSVMVCTGRTTGTPAFYFYDRNWRLLPLNNAALSVAKDFTQEKPAKISEMFDLAEKLSSGLPHVRVDLFFTGNQIYFGEMTLYSSSGFDANLLAETDALWGNLICLKKGTYNE